MKNSKRNSKMQVNEYHCEKCNRAFSSTKKIWYCSCGEKLNFKGQKEIERMIQK